MLIHIVKTGETVEKISNSYRILKSDLISNNLHITDFSHLKSGMKLKIPLISKDIIESLEESEAFIDDYYPTFENFVNETTEDIFVSKNEVDLELKEEIVKKEVVEEVIPNEVISQKDVVKQEYQEQVGNHRKTPNNSVFQYGNTSYYGGNVIPKYNEKFIKKI